jgi:transglutaminase superfamily protein
MLAHLRERCLVTASAIRLASAYAAFGVLKHLLPLTTLARWSWRDPSGSHSPSDEQRVIGRAIWVRRLIGRTDRDCLQRSLVLYRELSRAGADPTLMVGFARSDGGIRGHAWVVTRGTAVAELPAEVAGFVPAVSFGRRGTPASA